LNQTASNTPSDRKIIPRSEHGISRADISESALKVLYRLRKAGYEAFIVGGGVRDLLLGRHPKDFDVATNALPDDIRDLFRNSRLIGRRFRLAHVRFGREIIEVATFRAAGGESDEEDREHHAESGRILRDNVYGTIDEDIWRRDFTANALYYNIADFSVWDYTGGMADIEARRLRLIGDPEKRYREDPVRMLRAVRFAAKLDFSIDPTAGEPIGRLAPLLRDVPAARLFDEVLKLFQSGHGVRSFELLEQYGLLEYLFPSTVEALAQAGGEADRRFVLKGLANTDERIAQEKSVTPMFLFAVLLWPAIKARARRFVESGEYPEQAALTEACYRVVAEQQSHTSLPKRYGVPMREMLQLQSRFDNRKGARALRFLEHKRFRAAYDFMLLRADCGEVDAETAEWWTQVQEQPASEQRETVGVGRRKSGRRRGGRGRRRRGTAHDAAP
jgi:poly(A) polymerase